MEQPKLINNITERVVDDLRQRLSAQSRVSIAAASFPRVRPLIVRGEITGLDDFELITFLIIK